MCILQGCDYTDPIKGMGPASAFKLMQEHGSIEKVLENISTQKKFVIPQPFPYDEARVLFHKPEVISTKRDLNKMSKFTHVQEDKLKEFLVKEKGFAEKTINNQIKKLLNSYEKHGTVKVKAARQKEIRKRVKNEIENQ